ncbi:hypothetical protein [Colwellia sp. C1TZA3]|uniref:hypothetical protein n=1 Tax=Colwellia sp. C1TZA3 TaxID=2508879 RepID=UPI00174E0F1E|nr:hypothetical protein [Colwellia sp. C1TZA3]
MRIKKGLSSNQRKRTLHRNKIRLVNRRHTQFALDLCSNDRPWLDNQNELNLS